MYNLDIPRKSEYPILLNIWESSVKATHHFLKKDDIEFFKKAILENKIFDQADLVVARDANNQILGFMGISQDSLEMIFLHPDARGKGIGKLLLKHAIDNMRVGKVDVNEQNEEALKFYEHFGFKVTSRSELDGMGKPFPILHMQLK